MKRETEFRLFSSHPDTSFLSRKSFFPMKRSTPPMKFRRKNSHIFQLCYTELCSLHNTPMIFPIKAHLHKRMLDFNGDRVKLDEWRPILKALSVDRSLHLIAIRSKNSCSKVLEHIDTETKSRSVVKLPVLLTNFIFKHLITSLSRCISCNTHLKCLELDGLLLSGDYLELLLLGLEKSLSLQHLSLHRCPIGDDGCRLVCNALRNLPNVLTLDISGCNISEKGAYSIAKTLQYQNLNRYGENWKQSLRYRTPDTEIMPGLRRVTLNHNPLIRDCGVGHIINVLRDDLWLKALDLQNVGLTSEGGMELLDLLQENKCISVLDVHNNPDLDKSVFESIMSLLATNNLGKPSEYHWIQEETLYMPRKPSYQSRDPSVYTQRMLKGQEVSSLELHTNTNQGSLRLTNNSTVPGARKAQLQMLKVRSAPTFTAPHSKSIEVRTSAKASSCHRFGLTQKAALVAKQVNRWDHINGAGDSSQRNDMRAKLRELTSALEEERRRRIEAENQKADLEFRLEKLSQERKGQILIDANILKEIYENASAVHLFVAILMKRGLCLQSAANSERSSSPARSDMISRSTSLARISHDAELDLEDDVDEASQLVRPVSAIAFKDWEEVHRSDSSTSVNLSQVCDAEEKVQPDSHQKCERAKLMVEENTVQIKEQQTQESAQYQLQKVINEILENPTFQFYDLQKADAVSFIQNCDDSLPQTLMRKNSVRCISWPDSAASVKTACLINTGSKESLYTNAEQIDIDIVEDSNDSWVTEASWSAETSSSSTLTNLNAV